MVQATHARKAEFEYQQPTQRIKKVYKKTTSSKKTLVKVGIWAFIYGILVVYLCIKVSTMGYQMVCLEKDIDNLNAANHMLEFQIAEQISLDRVEMVATTELGMHKLDASNAIAVAAYQSEPKAISQESSTKGITKSTKIGQRSLEKLYSNLMLLAEQR